MLSRNCKPSGATARWEVLATGLTSAYGLASQAVQTGMAQHTSSRNTRAAAAIDMRCQLHRILLSPDQGGGGAACAGGWGGGTREQLDQDQNGSGSNFFFLTTAALDLVDLDLCVL